MNRNVLVPKGDNYGDALDLVLKYVSESGVGLKECLDNDSMALGSMDMKYFPKEYFGSVPSYGFFMNQLRKLPEDERDKFMEALSEVESGRYIREMEAIARKGDEDIDEWGNVYNKRFSWYDKLNKVAERRLDRIDKRRKERAGGEEKGMDLAIKLIGALKDADLLAVKDKIETIDAEFVEHGN